MHKYERYIIYPLLIIALFYGMSGKDIIESNAQQVYDEIIAKKITVVKPNNKNSIEITPKGIGLYEEKDLKLVIQHNDIRTYGKEGMTTALGTSLMGTGILNIYNNHNNLVVGVGASKPDEEGQKGGHGLINIYDKYGEDFRSYSY